MERYYGKVYTYKGFDLDVNTSSYTHYNRAERRKKRKRTSTPKFDKNTLPRKQHHGYQ